MLIKKLAVLGVCGAFLGTVALDQVKYTSFTASGQRGGSENGDVDGVGKLKIDADGTLRVHVSVSGLQGSTTYRVAVTGGDLEIDFGGTSGGITMTTNNSGHGNFNESLQIGPTSLFGTEVITLWIDDNGDNVMDDSEKRAVSAR
ncbi:MAG TPA: hypothetical protein VD997_11470 [Phycisphaerales bacterium]|nr:hypothetical protein [Phycisphaerales bacterium]